jgi:ParB family transcriptional regulator, chromosome partitioning protein
MANVAEKVGEMTKDKPVEKRRALGRGLESLLPGPRVVNPATNRNPVTPPVRSEGSSREADPTLSQSARKDGAPSEVDGTPAHTDAAPTREGELGREDATDSVTATSSTMHGSQVSATERREPGPPSVTTTPTIAASPSSQVSGTERREPGAPSLPEAASVHGTSVAGVRVGDLQAGAASESFDGVEVRELPLDLIDKNPYQTRHFTQEDGAELIELGKSIKAQGLIQPVTVREGKNGRFILIAGDRRTRAARWAEMKTIPAIVWDVTEQQAAEMTVIENLMREDLNCMDQTRAFVLLSSKFLMTQAEIAERMGMSRESVSNYMRLARLPQEVQDYLINGELEFSHARQLLKIEDDAMLLKVAERVVKEHIPVSELEELMLGGVPAAFKASDQEKEKRGARWVDPNVRAAQRDLERVLGMRVRIRDRNNKGKITIEYGTLEDFDRVVGALKGKDGR